MSSHKIVPIRKTFHIVLSLIFATSLLSLLAYVVFASSQVRPAGQLDTSFAVNGVLDTKDGTASFMQSDGSLLVVGRELNGIPNTVMSKYTPDGSLDLSFGSSGYVTLSMSGAQAYGATILPDSRIVLIGSDGLSGFIAAFQANGALDTTFGTNGLVWLNDADGLYWGYIAHQQDGKIIVAFEREVFSPYRILGVVQRFLPSGQPDHFAIYNGSYISWEYELIVDLMLPDSSLRVSDFLVEENEKIVLVGNYQQDSGEDFWIANFEIDQVLDDPDGLVNAVVTQTLITDTIFAEQTSLGGVNITKDGDILAVGYIYNRDASGDQPSLLLKFDGVTGALDSSFGHGGIITQVVAGDESNAFDVTVQADGKIVVAHQTVITPPLSIEIAYTRHHADGSLDPTFGISGVVSDAIGNNDVHFVFNPQIIPLTGRMVVDIYSGLTGVDDGFAYLYLSRYDMSHYVTETVVSMGTAKLMPSLTLTNTSESACQIEAARHPIPPGGAPADDGEMPMVWELATDCDLITADLQFSYTDTEILYGNNITETLLSAYISSDGTVWADACHTYTCTLDVDTNTIHVAGVDQLGFWSLGNRTEIVEPPPEPVEPPTEPVEYFTYLPVIIRPLD